MAWFIIKTLFTCVTISGSFAIMSSLTNRGRFCLLATWVITLLNCRFYLQKTHQPYFHWDIGDCLVYYILPVSLFILTAMILTTDYWYGESKSHIGWGQYLLTMLISPVLAVVAVFK